MSENGTERTGPAVAQGRSEAGQTASRASLLDVASLPAEKPATLDDAAMIQAAARLHEGLSAYYRDDLDAESVRHLALQVRQQLSLQTLSIVNAHTLGVLSMVREIELM